MHEQRAWNVIFLIDQNPPAKIVMLKRSAEKIFAPNLYTGVGGKVDPEDKTVLDSALRELEEETGIKNIPLVEFARCVIDRKYTLFYFWGLFANNKLPHTDDGTLEWVDIDKILEKEIIPTTQAMCRQWNTKGFRVDKPFTVYVKQIGKNGTVAVVEFEKTVEGLKV